MVFGILQNKFDRPVYVAAKTYHMLATRHYFLDGNNELLISQPRYFFFFSEEGT